MTNFIHPLVSTTNFIHKSILRSISMETSNVAQSEGVFKSFLDALLLPLEKHLLCTCLMGAAEWTLCWLLCPSSPSCGREKKATHAQSSCTSSDTRAQSSLHYAGDGHTGLLCPLWFFSLLHHSEIASEGLIYVLYYPLFLQWPECIRRYINI